MSRSVVHELPEVVAKGVAALEEQIYSHVVECIDFGRLSGIEQIMWSLLDQLGVDDVDVAGDVTKTMIRNAIVRAADDPWNTITDVPFGITKEEARAAKFDASCPFCRYEDEHPLDEEPHEDDCSCCADMAREWREKHADALRRRGLVPGRAPKVASNREPGRTSGRAS